MTQQIISKQNTSPLVSIIIPTFNRCELILQILNSLQYQTYQNWECIVVDDFSTDNTKNAIQFFFKGEPRIVYCENKKSKGAPGSRNTGLDLSRGIFVSFFDSDDKIFPNYIENKLKHFLENDRLDLVISLSKWIENGEEKYFTNIPTATNPLIRFYSLSPIVDIPWLTPTLIRKSFITENNIYWDETVKLHQDIQFNINLLSKNPVLFWGTKTVDWCWRYNKNAKNIGQESNDPIEIVAKMIDLYWNSLHDILHSPHLQKLVSKQYHAQLVAFCDKLSFLTKDNRAILSLFHNKSNFSFIDILLLRLRMNTMRNDSLNLMKKALKRILQYYFAKSYPPIITVGNFLNHTSI